MIQDPLADVEEVAWRAWHDGFLIGVACGAVVVGGIAIGLARSWI